MSALGNCERVNNLGKKACNGDLCVVKDVNNRAMVACASCRHPHLDHPLMKEMAEAEKAVKPPPVVKPSQQEFAPTWLQRIEVLERRCVRMEQQDSRLADLEARLAEVEKAAQGRRAK